LYLVWHMDERLTQILTKYQVTFGKRFVGTKHVWEAMRYPKGRVQTSEYFSTPEECVTNLIETLYEQPKEN